MVEGGGGEAHWQWYPGLAGLSPPSTLTCPPPGSTPDITTSGTHIDLTIDHFCNFTKTEKKTLSALIFQPFLFYLNPSQYCHELDPVRHRPGGIFPTTKEPPSSRGKLLTLIVRMTGRTNAAAQLVTSH